MSNLIDPTNPNEVFESSADKEMKSKTFNNNNHSSKEGENEPAVTTDAQLMNSEPLVMDKSSDQESNKNSSPVETKKGKSHLDLPFKALLELWETKEPGPDRDFIESMMNKVIDRMGNAAETTSKSKDFEEHTDRMRKRIESLLIDSNKLSYEGRNTIPVKKWFEDFMWVVGDYDVTGREAVNIVNLALKDDAANWLIKTARDMTDIESKNIRFFAELVVDKLQGKETAEFLVQSILGTKISSAEDIRNIRKIFHVLDDGYSRDQERAGIVTFLLPDHIKAQYSALNPKPLDELLSWSERLLTMEQPKKIKSKEDKKGNNKQNSTGGKKRKFGKSECTHKNHSPTECYFLHPEKRPKNKHNQ